MTFAIKNMILNVFNVIQISALNALHNIILNHKCAFFAIKNTVINVYNAIPLSALNAFQKSTQFKKQKINVIYVIKLCSTVFHVRIKTIAFSAKVTISILTMIINVNNVF